MTSAAVEVTEAVRSSVEETEEVVSDDDSEFSANAEEFEVRSQPNKEKVHIAVVSTIQRGMRMFISSLL